MFWVNSSRWAVRKVTNSQQVVTAALCTLPFPAQVFLLHKTEIILSLNSQKGKKKKSTVSQRKETPSRLMQKNPTIISSVKTQVTTRRWLPQEVLNTFALRFAICSPKEKKKVEVINCWIQTSGNQWVVRKPTCGSSYFRAVLINSWKTHRQEDLRKKYSSPYHITMQDNPIQPWFPSSLLLSFFIRYCRISLTSV